MINPADESVVAEVAYGGRADAERAIEAAATAFPAWRALSAYDRAKVLKKTADLMRERADAIARTLTMEQGKPLAEAKAEVLHSADTFEWFAEEGKRAYGQVIPPANVAKRHYASSTRSASSARSRPGTSRSRCQPQDRPGPGRRAAPSSAGRPTRRRCPLIQVFECLVEAGLPAGRRQPGDRPGPADRRRVPREPRRSARSASPARPRSASS